MQFSTNVFIFVFLPLTLSLFLLARSVRLRQVVLTVAGYVFYGYYDWHYCLLLAAVTAVGFTAALLIGSATAVQHRRLISIAALAAFLGALWFFKYFDFFAASANALVGKAFIPTLHILLPVGISFYTFNSIAYVIDVGAQRTRASRSFLEYLTFVSFFPHLASGPLVRFREIGSDLRALGNRLSGDRLIRGSWFFTVGLAKKTIIADSLARYVNPMVADIGSLSTVGAWQAALGYTFQLYYDFSGYSDMAVGLGHVFGVELPWNFNSPYRALGIRDFWRRWHMSLSRWLRDYLFLPISYSLSRKVGEFRALGFNQDYGIYMTTALFTMAVIGLWHGARWTFVLWGCYHGFLLAVDQFGSRRFKRLPKPTYGICTFVLVVFGWVVFRSPDLNTAMLWLERMVVPVGPLRSGSLGLMFLVLACTVGVLFVREVKDYRVPANPQGAIAQGALFFVTLLFMHGHNSTFLYYQF